MTTVPLQTHSAWSHLKTVDAAVARVKTWPEWKQKLTFWRKVAPTSEKET